MTKFVASFFLPMVLVGSALELAPVREKAVRQWRAWGVSALVVTLLAAPWFVYQMWQPDRELWRSCWVNTSTSGSMDGSTRPISGHGPTTSRLAS